MERIFIIGGSGFLGGDLAAMAVLGWDTFVSFCSTPVYGNGLYKAIFLDIRNKGDVEKNLFETSPKFVINVAAVSNFYQCEKDEKLSWQVNFN